MEKELLKKILPLNFAKEYIENANPNANAKAKEFNMICVLFTDIVNYTELAKKYNPPRKHNVRHILYQSNP